MPIEDDISHILSVAKWKVKQQGQIIHLQGEISELESQIGIQKSILSEQTYKLFLEEKLAVDALIPFCEKIQDLYSHRELKQQELDIIRNQTPPANKKAVEKAESSTVVEAAQSVESSPVENIEPKTAASEPIIEKWVEDVTPSEPVAQSTESEWIDAQVPTKPTSNTEPSEWVDPSAPTNPTDPE